MYRRMMAVLGMLALTAAACSTTDEPTGPAVTIAATADGSTITVTATITGLDIVVEPPSAEHFHYFLDTEPVLDGTPIPSDDPAIIHSREATATFTDVAAGEHTLTVVMADGEHIPLDPAVTSTTTVTV